MLSGRTHKDPVIWEKIILPFLDTTVYIYREIQKVQEGKRGFIEEKEHPQADTGMRRLLAQQFTPLEELNHVIKVKFDNNFYILTRQLFQIILPSYP